MWNAGVRLSVWTTLSRSKLLVFVGCTASYFIKFIWCSCWFCTPPPYFEAVYCFICGRRRVAVVRYRMICLVIVHFGPRSIRPWYVQQWMKKINIVRRFCLRWWVMFSIQCVSSRRSWLVRQCPDWSTRTRPQVSYSVE